MTDNYRVVIDSSSRIVYSSFYIEGLYDVFGRRNVSFSSKYFTELRRDVVPHSFDHYMAFVIINRNGLAKKYIIDFRDKPSIKEIAYEWCDIYAKINFNIKLTDKKFHDKIILIPPGFSIKIWNLWQTMSHCFLNYFKCSLSPIVSLKTYISDYYIQYKKLSINEYLNIRRKNRPSDRPYVFFIATLWPQINCIQRTNIYRKNFIEAVRAADCSFEGGFYASRNHPQYIDFKDLVLKKRYSIEEYSKKVSVSDIVFNTPATHDCHGWRFGEYMILGKAIISTELSNEIPDKPVHGENIHFVKDTNEIYDAVKTLLSDIKYRKKIENGAYAYYCKNLRPEKVIERIVLR